MPIPSGAGRTERFTVPTTNSLAIPIDVNKIYIVNGGTTNQLQYNFEDDGDGKYASLKPGQQSNVIGGSIGGRTLEFDTDTGTTDCEVVMWAE